MLDLPLLGCRPEPLINYLKALGVLRSIVEQEVDLEARAYWRDDVFHIVSRVGRHELRNFFLNRYAPSPIVAPWGARSGFYSGSSEKSARKAIERICEQADARFKRFRAVVDEVRQLLKDRGISAKAKDEEKLALLEIGRAS